MHISGKIFAWVLVLGAIGATILASKTLAIRNGWAKIAQKNKDDFLANKEKIDAKKRELAQKQGELARTMMGWDRYWQPHTARILGRELTLSGLGTTNGVSQNQVLYVFAIKPDGTSKYVGDFRVTRANDTVTVGLTNWFWLAGDVTSPELTTSDFPVRVRTMIPPQFLARLGALDQQLLAAQQTYQTNEAELGRQAQLAEQTDKLIASRLSEINGEPAFEGKALPAVHIKGLISAMADEEEARNAALLESDRLLRSLKQAREDIEKTLKANQALTESLPQPAGAEQTVGRAG